MTDYKKEMTRHESITHGRVDVAEINAALLFDQVAALQQELGQWKMICEDLERKNGALNEINNSLLSRVAILEDVLRITTTPRNS